MRKKIKLDKFNIILGIIFVVTSLEFIIPLLVVVNASLMSQEGINKFGFTILPRMINLDAYSYVLKNPERILSAYKISIVTSVISLVLYLFMASSAAYVLANKKFAFRRAFAFFLFFTMLFQGGLAPTYIWMTQYLHLKDTIWALIFPILNNVWYVFIIRTFFQQIPRSLSESATIDGASEFTIYFKIMLPLSKPVMATVGVMSLLFFWSSWMPALLYVDDKNLVPLQYLLQIMLRNIEQISRDMEMMPVSYGKLDSIPEEPVRMAMAIIAAGPMLVIFPFFQKYFVKGMTIGSIKG
jgi:putative aldouronate transport system permease protein